MLKHYVKNMFACVVPSSSQNCLYLSIMVVPCCLQNASLGSAMNWSVISVNMRAPLESLIFSISLTCRDQGALWVNAAVVAPVWWRLLEMAALPCWTISWAASLSHGTRPGRGRASPVPEPAPRPDASSSHHPRWRPPSGPALLHRTKAISQQLNARASLE